MIRPREIRITGFDGAEHTRVAVPPLPLSVRLAWTIRGAWAAIWRVFRPSEPAVVVRLRRSDGSPAERLEYPPRRRGKR